MELTFRQTPVQHLQLRGGESVYQEETAEIIVPDSLPDIGRIVDCFGAVLVQSQSCQGGQAVISGGIQAGALYVPEGEETIQRVEAYLPFTVKKELGQVVEGEETLFTRPWLRNLDARAVNSRKLLFRANLGMLATGCCGEQTLLFQVENPPRELQLLQNTYPMTLPVAWGEKEFSFNDEVELPESAPDMERLLKTETAFRLEDSKVIGNKVVFRGQLCLHILYETPDGNLHTWDGQVPISQYIELAQEAEEGAPEVTVLETAVEVETDGQRNSHRLLVNMDMVAQALVYDQVPVELTEDAYAIGGVLQPQWQQPDLSPRLDRELRQEVGAVTIPGEVGKVLEAHAWLDQPALRREEDTLWATVPVVVWAMFYDRDNRLQSRTARGEISCRTTAAPGAQCRAWAEMTGEPSLQLTGEGMEVRTPVQVTLDTYGAQNSRNLSGGTLEPAESQTARPSVIVRRAGRERLWDVAKSSGTTVAAIQAANGLDGDSAQEGAVLLIPMA